jgi:hypothetical protein
MQKLCLREAYFVIKAEQENTKRKVPKVLSDKFSISALKSTQDAKTRKPVDPVVLDNIMRAVNRKSDISDPNFDFTFKYLRLLVTGINLDFYFL